ncbi:DUF1266 domain-containing protein [Parapedobacter tibetensis]|uniref:DUF1266 domain-containing protein n=1 Tax=Parapedobacter tibetensis TaxID=2972951 RepID=UPI00214DE738|nr:DUF1266 domain-containing protein [Parapedobacter tibetensis]
MMKKRKQQQLAKFSSKTPLTDEQKRALVFGAILSYTRGEKILDTIPDRRLDEYAYGLSRQWEVTNTEEAKQTIANLLNLKRSMEFEVVLRLSSPELSQIQERIAKGLKLDLSTVAQTKSAYAWDTCRAVSLAKWCYWVGHITEQEAWDYINQAADKGSELGENWTDYTVSFLLGRTIQGFDLDDVIIEAEQLVNGKGPSMRKIDGTDAYLRFPFKN